MAHKAEAAARSVSRRDALRLLGLGAMAIGIAGCGSGRTAISGAGPGGSTPANWGDLVAAAKREGKVVVNGSPDPMARPAIVNGFKAAYGIEVEYLGGNSSQLAARVQNERAAGQYIVDAGISGSDTVYATLLPNGWLDPVKPILIQPDASDGSKWKTGEPWFRDPDGDKVLQILNTVTHPVTLNTQLVRPEDISTADALLDPRWKGKMCAYDPSVNGSGIGGGAAVYIAKGKEFAARLYRDQGIVLSRDAQQVADWVGHGAYPIGLAVGHSLLEPYTQAGVAIVQPSLPDLPDTVGGAFGLVFLWSHAPHPNAAKVFVNWMASREGMEAYARAVQQAPIRNDIDASWVPAQNIPKAGVKYLDTYTYDFETKQRIVIRDFYASILK